MGVVHETTPPQTDCAVEAGRLSPDDVSGIRLQVPVPLADTLVMRRAGQRSRAEARRLTVAHLKHNRSAIVRVVVVMTLACVALVAAMGVWRGREMAWFCAGGAAVSIAWVLAAGFDSSEIRRWRDGAEGERLTAAAVTRLYRAGWRGVDHVEIDRGDVDHVVVGPGGVFALETKWTNERWQITNGHFTNPYATDALLQARRGAERVALMLKWTYDVIERVQPVLVIRGPGRPDICEPTEICGVLVVPGELLKGTLTMRSATMDAKARDEIVDAIWNIVDRHEHDDHVRMLRSKEASDGQVTSASRAG